MEEPTFKHLCIRYMELLTETINNPKIVAKLEPKEVLEIVTWLRIETTNLMRWTGIKEATK
jgi:hypothetical protein